MNIRLTYNEDLEYFKELFPEIKLFNRERDADQEIDLLIFPGGADVSPEYYMDKEMLHEYEDQCKSDKKRDRIEMQILTDALSGELKVKKILGICRGIQLINVFMGGILFADLPSYGIGHENMHKLLHTKPNNLIFFSFVNSLHHQGIRILGNGTSKIRNLNTKPVIIATDGSGYVPEIVTWHNEKILGLQFHPEYYSDGNKDKISFKDFIYTWIKEEITVFKSMKSNDEKFSSNNTATYHISFD